jgi:AcrR family transcriptional regulator
MVHMNKRSGDASRQRILTAAQAVFAEYGYAQASMRAIARKAGISVGGLYLYFKNKEELYLTFMQDWMNSLNDATQQALTEIDDPVEAIKAFIEISVDYARSHREIMILQGRELGISFGSEFKRKFSRDRQKLIGEIVRKGMAQGVFRACDPDEAAKVIFNMMRGFVASMAIDEDSLFSVEESVSLVLHGLMRRDNG